MALKLSLTHKVVGLAVLALLIGSIANVGLASVQNQALLRSELLEADIDVSVASTEQLGGGIRFAKPEALQKAYDGLKASLGDQFAGGMSFSKQGELLEATDGSEPHQAALTALAREAQTAEAVRTSIADSIIYVAVPARFGPGKPVVGTAAFAWDMSDGFAHQNQATLTTALVGLAIIAVLTLILYLFVRASITGPLRKLVGNATAIAADPYSVKTVPGTGRGDELGEMARSVEIFRDNGIKVSQMNEEEAARIARNQAERTAMMGELRAAFGHVVDAAVVGDFSRRLDTNFPDAELNQLGESVNNLVDTVDKGLDATAGVLKALASANLSMRMRGDYRGAFASLADSANQVGEQLTDLVGRLRQTSRALKTATGEILSGANDLSQRTTRQAATIEETSAAVEQLAGTVGENAMKADAASAKAGAVARAAQEGGTVMEKAEEAMERITASSGKISNIIGLIDDIAFQTNLLALNASVEAARAGDAGKGFAVVAVEVRRLAQSAASASAEIKGLIEASVEEVADGSRLVAEAAGKLGQMQGAVEENTALLEAIAIASRAQASAIEDVAAAVRQMDEMTQHNAALVEETNAAIEQTEAQAVELDGIVDIFTLDDREDAGLRRPVGRAA